jgi:hypothetical protein
MSLWQVYTLKTDEVDGHVYTCLPLKLGIQNMGKDDF